MHNTTKYLVQENRTTLIYRAMTDTQSGRASSFFFSFTPSGFKMEKLKR
jgi:hypothetical protein